MCIIGVPSTSHAKLAMPPGLSDICIDAACKHDKI